VLLLGTFHSTLLLISNVLSPKLLPFSILCLVRLTGMSPLYKDYESTLWWFEIPKFIVTLFLCGLVTLLPTEGASQVFVSGIVSLGMLVLLANSHPYLDPNDDLLAQLCQLSLTLALMVGLLEQASANFQVGQLTVLCL
jgi:hypothetical protein